MENERHRKRLKHYDIPGQAHFLTFSCYRRFQLLSKDRTRLWFLEALDTARTRHQFDLWAWVIMPEHIHLLIYPKKAAYQTSKILASIKKPVGYRAIEFLRGYAPEFLQKLAIVNANRTYYRFWQAGAGYDENVDDLRAIYEIIDYIHFNPIRRGLVDAPTDWRWSSARDWAGAEHLPIDVDRTLPSLQPR